GQRSADRRQELIDAGWFAVRASELLEPGGARCEPGVGEVVHPATQRLGLGESSMGLGERCQTPSRTARVARRSSPRSTRPIPHGPLRRRRAIRKVTTIAAPAVTVRAVLAADPRTQVSASGMSCAFKRLITPEATMMRP